LRYFVSSLLNEFNDMSRIRYGVRGHSSFAPWRQRWKRFAQD
jgi:hypothetical protein